MAAVEPVINSSETDAWAPLRADQTATSQHLWLISFSLWRINAERIWAVGVVFIVPPPQMLMQSRHVSSATLTWALPTKGNGRKWTVLRKVIKNINEMIKWVVASSASVTQVKKKTWTVLLRRREDLISLVSQLLTTALRFCHIKVILPWSLCKYLLLLESRFTSGVVPFH